MRVYKQNKIDTIDYIDAYAVTTFQKDEESNEWKIINGPKPHIVIKTSSNNIVYNENIVSWGKVPVSVLYNNDTEQTDLEMFKSDVDAYDIIKSDFINSFEDFQELYWILKGYDGQDPAQFMKEFKMSRILKVSEDGDAKQVSQEVPYEARQTALNILKIDIFRFAMAVDLEGLKGDTTNLTIKAMFSNLDLKANSFEDQIEEFIYSVNYFVDKYQEITKGKPIPELEITFDRSIILNKEMIIESLIKQVGFRAKEKLLAEHPDVTDVEEEIKALDAEREKQIDLLGGQLGFGDDDEDK